MAAWNKAPWHLWPPHPLQSVEGCLSPEHPPLPSPGTSPGGRECARVSRRSGTRLAAGAPRGGHGPALTAPRSWVPAAGQGGLLRLPLSFYINLKRLCVGWLYVSFLVCCCRPRPRSWTLAPLVWRRAGPCPILGGGELGAAPEVLFIRKPAGPLGRPCCAGARLHPHARAGAVDRRKGFWSSRRPLMWGCCC